MLLADGSTVTADDSYIRESLLQPNAKIVAGFQPVMPTFQGQLTEEQIVALTAYIKSLQTQAPPATGRGRCTGHGEEISMSTSKQLSPRCRDIPHEHYLNSTYGIRSWLLTTDHKRIAILYLISVTFFFFVGGIFAHHDPHSSADAQRLPGYAGNLQQALHHARRGDDFLFSDPVDSGGAGQFPDSADGRRKGPGLSRRSTF